MELRANACGAKSHGNKFPFLSERAHPRRSHPRKSGQGTEELVNVGLKHKSPNSKEMHHLQIFVLTILA